ncbi:hypothetical protein L332_03395 [Agrococcus pavilionensis RW1]|uniref:Phage recombination protein Bet n=1 Tax=Agrococcus pavilionensis RW1 TaxID=1330458 RepID=U1MS56_9MICO|nr:phage recombination protein Bet [Agrococcus pavilionensis]ERG63500.1 hypothetical protein L332_03395 [Agrococcus pavilionensis RW1]
MSTAVAALPTTVDSSKWSADQKAIVEAAGLVHVTPSGEKVYADTATVGAFLAHCNRTNLDPIAKQIYCLARKTKAGWRWSIQVSIDGARLVAQRSGEYEGQTTPEFTADGVTWTQVWLEKEPPKAARVGVYRRGFREPLYAVALWDAYVQTRDEWVQGQKTGKQLVSEMWLKMGPLMLAKCAEMLALRKAFPHDLSGLYSEEEMSQAEGVVYADDEPQAAVEAAPGVPESVAAAVPGYVPPWDAERVREFVTKVDNEVAMKPLVDLYNEAHGAGVLGLEIDERGETIEHRLVARRRLIEEGKATPRPEPVVEAEPVEEAESESVPMALDVEGGEQS